MIDVEINAKTIAVGAAAVVGLYWLAKREAGEALQAVNPVNRDNVVHRGANAVGAAVSDDPDFNLGSWLFEVFNPDAVAREREVLSTVHRRDAPLRNPHPPEAGTGVRAEDLRDLGTSDGVGTPYVIY